MAAHDPACRIVNVQDRVGDIEERRHADQGRPEAGRSQRPEQSDARRQKGAADSAPVEFLVRPIQVPGLDAIGDLLCAA